jgi:hypothetical protein
MQMQKALFDRLVDFLTPYMGHGNGVPAFVTQALFGQQAVLNQIRHAPNARDFTIHFVDTLAHYDGAGSGYPALVAVLEGLRHYMGQQQQILLDELIRQLGRGSVGTPSLQAQTRIIHLKEMIERLQQLNMDYERALLAYDQEYMRGLQLAVYEANVRNIQSKITDTLQKITVYQDEIRTLGG